MRSKFLSVLSAVTLFMACGLGMSAQDFDSSEDFDDVVMAVDTVAPSRSLNDIRFDNWDEARWLDNDYIRALRAFFNDIVSGDVVDEELTPMKSLFTSQFTVASISPALFGGTDMYVFFLDDPTKVFNAWVYSDVDAETETVGAPQVRYVHLMDEPFEITKEEVLELLQLHPENKLW